MAGRRYSAGRIFLDVIPSFKGVIRETAREAQKVRAEVEKDNAEAAAKEEQAQGKIRKRERVKAERDANDAVLAEQRAAWKKLAREEKLQQAARARARKRAEQLEVRNSLAGLVKQLDEADRKLADAHRRRERDRVKAEERAAKMVQDTWVTKGREMWAEVQADAKKAARERERIAKEAADAEVAAQKQAVERAKRDLRAAQREYAEIRNKRLAADRAAARKWDSEFKRMLDAQTKEVQRAAKMQGGRFGQELRKGIGHALADLDEVKVTADTKPVMREVAALRAALENLRSKRIGVDIDGKRARAELVAIERAARRLDRRGVDIHVRTNAKGVSAVLQEMTDSMRAAGRSSADLGNRHVAGRDRALDAANAFRLFNARILAITLAVPLVVPMIGALAGAIGMLVPMTLGAVSGLGVLIAGLTGIAPAVSALGDVQQNAAKDSLAYEKSMRNAARAVRDARQGVERAEQQAARAAEDSARRVEDAREGVVDATNRAAEQVQSALRRQREAEKDLTRAQKDSADAQRDLTQARQDAQDRLRDMALRAAGGALAERQAKLDLARAKAMYLSTRDDGSATREEKEQALLNYERAELDVAEIIQSNKELAEERAHADKVGVEGMEEVVRAKERVVDTTEREREAEERLADAQKDVTRARVEGAESIADAQRDLADAVRDQQRQQQDSAIAMRDAQERLIDAQLAYQEALTQTGEIGSASMQKLRDAMDDLGPEGREFARFLHSLREPLLQLRRDVQAGLLPGVQKFMEDMIRVYGPGFSRWATEMGVVLGDIFRQMSVVFQNPLMTAFFDSMEKYGATFTQQAADIMLNLVQVIAGLSTAFAPFAEGFGDALVRITAGWAAWAGGLSESDGFHRFMAYVERVGPIVVDLFVALGEALINLGIGLAPYGEMLINWATDFFTWIAKADPKMIGAIAAGIIGIVVAIQLAALAMAMLSGWGMFFGKNKAGGFHNPFALLVLGVIGLITSIAILRDRYEWFDEMMVELTEKSKELAKWLWENRDAVAAVAGALGLMFGAWKFSGPLMTGLGFLTTALGGLGKASGWVLRALGEVGGIIMWLVRGAIPLLNRAWTSLAWFAIQYAMNPMAAIMGVLSKVGGVIMWLMRTPLALLSQAWYSLVWFALRFAINPLGTMWALISKVGVVALWLVRSPIKLLGAAFGFLVSPLTLTIGAIALLITFLIWAWREHEGFRNAILDIWERIKEGVAAFADWFSTDGVGGISAAWDWLVNAMLWGWENIAKPVWNGMVEVFQWVADMLVDNIFPIIGNGLKILWGVIELVWLWIKRKLGEGSGWWSEHKDQVLDVLASIGAFFADFYENGIKPTFELIGDIIFWFFDKVVDPVFRNVARAVTTMVDAFRSGESLIASIWAGIVAGVSEPVNVVINWINKHLVGNLNDLMADIGLSWKIPDIPTVTTPKYVPRDKGLKTGTKRYGAGTGTSYGRFATGGVLPGYSPGVDNIRFTSPFGDLLLGGGEAILRPEVTAVLGKGWVDMVNAAAINGGQDGVRRRVLGQYASGGQIDFAGLPRQPRTDVAEPPKTPAGKKFWEMIMLLKDAVTNPGKALNTVIDKLVPYLPLQDTFPGQYVVGMMRKVANLFGEKSKELQQVSSAQVGNSMVNYGGSLGWAPGVGPMTWPTTWKLIQAVAPESRITSTFRPGAITASGYPSLHGLGRAVDIVSPNMAETFMKIRNLRRWSQLFYSPMGNLQIGYRDAIVHRTHFDHIHAAYDKGGIFDRADFDGNVGLYDAGGVLDDRDLGLNLSGKPEAVLTNDQWRALEAAAEALHRRDGGGGTVYAPQLTTIQGATAGEISDELMWDLRSFERRGGARGDG